MQREVLIIDGKQVDVIPNSINRNLQINDLGSADDRQSNYSNTVKLPLTSNNQMVFEFLGVSGNTSRSAYKRLPCSYSVDGIPLIVNGFAEIKATGEHYEVVLYDGIVDFGEKIKDKKLKDINYSDLNHYLSTNTYQNSLTNTSGYIYALGDFGVNQYGIKVERQVPSIYTHTLWDKIFNEAGVAYSGDFFTNEDYLTEVVTPPIGYEVADVSAIETPIGSYDTTLISRFDSSKDPVFYEDTFGFNTTFSDPAFTFGIDGKITINQDISTKMNLSIDYSNSGSYVRFKVYLNGGMIKSYFLEGGSPLVGELNFTAKSGDVLQFRLSGSGDYSDLDGGVYMIDYSASANIGFSEVSGGFLVDFNKMMGDLDQIEFIKDVMTRHGLVIRPVKGTTGYDFIQFEDLLTNRINSEDWTNKLVSVGKESYGTKYAKINTAKYKYPKEIQEPTHDGVLSISDANASPEKTLFSSPYEIPKTQRKHQQIPLYYHPVWEEKDIDGNTVIEAKDAPIKVFRIKRVNNSFTFKYFNDINSTSFTGDIPYLSLEKMDMQYFLNTNYKAYGGVIDNYKELDVDLDLKELDIYDLDFFRLKYLQQTGKYYYLSKVQHKSGVKTSKSKLVEINQFLPNLPVDVLGTYNRNATYGSNNTLTVNNLTTQTTPTYFDPEYDAAYAIKFTSGFNNQVKLYQAGVEIIDDTEILVADWDVTYKDMSTTTAAHDVSFTFMIKDEGSMTYGSEVGTFNVSILEYTNNPPVANAGANQTKTINTDLANPDYIANLDGSASFDSTGSIVSYVWSITSSPIGNTTTINDSDTSEHSALVNIPNEIDNEGIYTIQLTVTDNFGLTDTDTMTLTVDNSGTTV